VTDLDAIYASHPVSERNICARLARQNVALTGLSEWSLAIDPETDISDQNHPGGVESVLALAAAARISAGSVVVDVGAGIGGSARVLAEAFGCSVVGIELNHDRCEQAIRLTSLVGLASRVRFVEYDVLSGTGGVANADVLWGQSAWAHFPSPEYFLDRWLPVLRPSGRVALSDAFLVREPDTKEDAGLLRELQRAWSVHLVTIERWRSALETKRCDVVHLRDRTEEARAHFKNLLAVSLTWPDGTVTADERAGWAMAGAALDRGLITLSQLVAMK
jgi:predicted O-methyltransferase YrrM